MTEIELEEIVENGIDSFWSSLDEDLLELKEGDTSSEISKGFEIESYNIIKEWIESNLK